MKDLSIENLKEKIYFSKTKVYFDEVLQNYYSKSYRSAVVMLYSVVVSDLIQKLKELELAHGDLIAKEILEAIEKKQKDNPKSPDWEKKLIDELRVKTNLINTIESAHIDHLINHRHLCAHPVITEDELLFTPMEVDVRAHLLNMLNGVLIKPPFFSPKIVDQIILTLSTYPYLFEEKEMEKQLKIKYFQYCNETIVFNLFKRLWKFVVNLKNPDTDKNLSANFSCLKILLRNYYDLICDSVKSNPAIFQKDIERINETLEVVNLFPSIQRSIGDYLNIEIEKHLNKCDYFDYLRFYKFAKFEDYHDNLIDILNNNTYLNNIHGWIRLIETIYAQHSSTNKLKDLCFKLFQKSVSYDLADIWQEYIKLKIGYQNLSKNDFLTLFDIIDNNSQIFGRRNHPEEYKLLKNTADKMFPNVFDFKKYNSAELFS